MKVDIGDIKQRAEEECISLRAARIQLQNEAHNLELDGMLQVIDQTGDEHVLEILKRLIEMQRRGESS